MGTGYVSEMGTGGKMKQVIAAGKTMNNYIVVEAPVSREAEVLVMLIGMGYDLIRSHIFEGKVVVEAWIK